MVRKDAKIGFAIGGILLLVLVAYVIAISGGKKPRASQDELSLSTASESAGGAVISDPHLGADGSPAPKVDQTASEPASTVAGNVAPAGDASRDNAWTSTLQRGEIPKLMVAGTADVGSTKIDPGLSTPSPTDQGSPVVTRTETPENAESTKIARDALGGGVHERAVPKLPSGSKSHTIEKGDTLARIAAATYGSPNKVDVILKANPGLNPSRLKIGQVLVLPEVSDATSAAATTSDVAVVAKKSVDSKTEYEVQSGDTLHRIASKLYGQSSKWQEIYDLNKSAIGADPAKLKLHMVLKLPAAPTAGGSTASATN